MAKQGEIWQCVSPDPQNNLVYGQIYISLIDWAEQYHWITVKTEDDSWFTSQEYFFKLLLKP
jgi:hypothetical protein